MVLVFGPNRSRNTHGNRTISNPNTPKEEPNVVQELWDLKKGEYIFAFGYGHNAAKRGISCIALF